MKKVLNIIGFSALAIVAGGTAAFAASGSNQAICKLVGDLGGLFKTLRTLAFVGAAFTIANWAWDYISKGKAELKDVKDKGIGMLVGFVLLFSIGLVLEFLMMAADPNGGSLECAAEFKW